MIHSFPPVVSARSRLLILGTMPGVKSLQMQQYYAHPQNLFWKLMFQIHKSEFSTDYNQRKQLIQNNNLALWDVLHTCTRAGSLDSDIENEVPNEIEQLLQKHPSITAIAFNGQAAAKYFERHIHLSCKVKLISLPSTSPANASVSFEKKLALWRAAITTTFATHD